MATAEKVESKNEKASSAKNVGQLDHNAVEEISNELRKLLAEHEKEEQVVARQLVHDFAARFKENHKLAIRFTDEAADRLATLALDQKIPVRDLCATRFKDFQFGLKLIAQNTSQEEFTIDTEAVEAPDKVLSEWVVKSYKRDAAG